MTAVLVAIALAAATPAAVAVSQALKTPGELTVEATSPKGALVAYAVTSDVPAVVVCNPPSNTVFPLGSTGVTCTGGGATASFLVTVVDTSPPVFSGVPNGIVTKVNGVRSVVVTFPQPAARDAVDGTVPVSCSPPSGSRFGVGRTEVTCSAVDEHGSLGSASFFVDVQDKTAPPALTDVILRSAARSLTLTWRLPQSRDAVGAEVVRFPGGDVVYRGGGTSFTDSGLRADATYRYVLASFDRANNLSRAVTVAGSARPTPLIQPQAGATLTVPPLLAWEPVAGAHYYNVQLWALLPKGPVKILSIWPKANQLQLTSTWVYNGAHRLAAGKYRWYVWPGIGAIVQARYGKLIGSSTFEIQR